MANYGITPANVKTAVVDGVKPLISRLTAGMAITAGATVAVSSVDGLAYLQDITDPILQNISGIALNNCSTSQPVDVIQGGYVDVGAVATAGDVAVGSSSASGALSPYGDLLTADVVTVAGFFVSASLLKVNIDNVGVAKG